MSSEHKPGLGEIGGQMARGAAWMVAMRWIFRGIGLVSTLIVARLLTPDDFGVIAMATIVVGFVQVLTDANTDIALLQNTESTEEHYNSAWTLQIAINLCATAALWLVAPLVADFYGDERVQVVVQIIALRGAILAFENVGVVQFRRDLQFRREFNYWIARRLILFFFTVTLAATLKNYWALAAAAPVSAAITVALSYRVSPYRPRFGIKRVREIWTFSRWLIIYGTSSFLSSEADKLVVGKVGTSTDMGHYHIASEISAMATRELVLPIGRAMMPAYARIAHSPEDLQRSFLMTISFVALICFSAGFGGALVAEDLVHVVLGSQWTAAVPLFRWLSIYALFEGLAHALQPFFWTKNKERQLAVADLAYLAILVPAVSWVGTHYALETIAITRMAVRGGTLLYLYVLTAHVGEFPLSRLLSVLWRPALAVVPMSAAVLHLHRWPTDSAFLSLVFDVGIGAVVFTATVLGLWILAGRPDGAERFIAGRVVRWAVRR